MSHSSGRGQVEPVVALVAVFAVSVGVGVYVGVLADVLPEERERSQAEPALDRAVATADDAGVVVPGALSNGSVAPEGWHANVTLRAGGNQWSDGPMPPRESQRATRRIGVRTAPGRVQPGRITVAIWR